MAAATLAGLLAGCGKKNEPDFGLPGAGEGKVIATYKGGEVTQAEFDKYAAFMEVSDPMTAMYMGIPEFKEQFVRQFALYKALAARASIAQLKKADEDVKTFETSINNAIKQDSSIQDKLKERNLTMDEMKQIVKMMSSGSQIAMAKREELGKAVKDEEIKAEYDKNKADYNVVTVRHILVATKDSETGKELRTEEEALKRAREVKDKLVNGGDWTALAKAYSDDPGSKDNGGLYEKQKAGGWVAEFKEAANKQPIGQIGDPVKTAYGYHVIKVESREESTYDKLAQTDKDAIKQEIVDGKVSEYLEAEAEKLNIQVTLPPEPSPSPSSSPAAEPAESASPSPSASAGP